MSDCNPTYLILNEEGIPTVLHLKEHPARLRFMASDFFASMLPPPQDLQLVADGDSIRAKVDVYGEGIVVEVYNWYLNGVLIEKTEDPEYTFTGLEYGRPYHVQASIFARTAQIESQRTDFKTITLEESDEL